MSNDPKPPVLPNANATNSVQPSMGQTISGKFSTAAAITAKQLELTKLTTLTLPGLYKQLGTQLYKFGTCREVESLLFQELDQLAQQHKELKTAKPSGEGFAAKSKAVLNATKDMAHAKIVESRISAALQKLGIAGHGSAKSIPELIPNCGLIDSCVTKIAELKTEIAGNKNTFNGTGWYSRNKRVVNYVAGGLAAIILLFIFYRVFIYQTYSEQENAKRQQLLIKADKAWDNNDLESASDGYQKLADSFSFKFDADVQDRRRVYNRLIDYRLKVGGVDQARKYIRDANSQNILLTLTYPNWQEIIAQEKSDYENERESRRQESRSRSSSSDNKAYPEAIRRNTETLKKELKKSFGNN